ncbi:MAG: dihydroorotate dehydrogenase [Nitrososphaerota archaeon]|nr:dihydroorotate dehydrogenase [Candidatus Bathyarchaeota archaeon]MDW8194386.1 dihydroorotate dehydrogenase [Nitrososphaerota archaeon]
MSDYEHKHVTVVKKLLNSEGLSVNLAGLSLRNPTMLASGILGYSADALRSIVDGGAGAVVTKSVGLKPRAGYPNPTVVQTSCGLINAVGLPNPGINEFVKEISEAKKVLKVPLIVSVYGFSAEEYAIVSRKAVESGADALELNVSCPHVKETGSEIGQKPAILAELIRKVKATVEKPVFVKLSPNVTDIAELAEVAIRSGADGIIAINTVRAMAIDIETAKPILSNKRGGLSGPAIKPVALRCVYDIYERINAPLIGCGGIMNWRDAVEFMLAGATAVQIGTAIAIKGLHIFRSVVRGIAAYLKKKGFKEVSEIVGLAHRS